MINDFSHCSTLLDFHLFADGANLFCKHKNLRDLETILNNEVVNVHTWLCTNRLSLNIDKSNFVIFHSPQKKLPFGMKLFINDKVLNQEFCITYYEF